MSAYVENSFRKLPQTVTIKITLLDSYPVKRRLNVLCTFTTRDAHVTELNIIILRIFFKIGSDQFLRLYLTNSVEVYLG